MRVAVAVLVFTAILIFSTLLSMHSARADPDWKTYLINIDGRTYAVRYEITPNLILANYTAPDGNDDFRINSMSASVGRSELIVDLSSQSDGTLALELPRNVIQSISNPNSPDNGNDIPYRVLINNQEASFQQTDSNSQNRVLQIDFFGQGDKRIEIIGTWIVPEFFDIGGIAIFASSMLGTIISYRIVKLRSQKNSLM
jgi:hypothetical protein